MDTLSSQNIFLEPFPYFYRAIEIQEVPLFRMKSGVWDLALSRHERENALSRLFCQIGKQTLPHLSMEHFIIKHNEGSCPCHFKVNGA